MPEPKETANTQDTAAGGALSLAARVLYVRQGELQRLVPFFALYLLLFAAFSLADGLALALFVKNVGSAYLPQVYAFVAVATVALMGLYVFLAERLGSVRTFHVILGGSVLLFGIAWVGLLTNPQAGLWHGLLFAGREIAFTLMLMHFGTFLQDYFTRDELNRVLPLVYSGGRVGGVLGGFLLQGLAAAVGVVNLLGLFVVLCVVGMVLLAVIARRQKQAGDADDQLGDSGVVKPWALDGKGPEEQARTSCLGFLRFAWASPLLFWFTISTVLYMVCRWILNYEYSTFFGSHFEDDQALAEFLGYYTQWALLGALIVQVLVVNRLIAWVGLKGSYLIYSGLLVGGMLLCLGPMTLGLAVFARLIETELRFGLRNPITMLITNKFPKSLRARVRAWNLGSVTPLGTLVCSQLLVQLTLCGATAWVPWLGGLIAVLYLLTSFGLLGSFTEPAAQKKADPRTEVGRQVAWGKLAWTGRREAVTA